MAKGKQKKEPDDGTAEVVLDSPYIGADEPDDLSDMEYLQDESKPAVDTHPPETDEDAKARAEMKADEEEEEDDEGEDEDEKEDDEKEDDEKEDDEKEDDEKEDDEEMLTVPKARFDEVNDRMKKAEERGDKLEARLNDLTRKKEPEPEPEPYDFDTKEAEAMEALLEGDSDKYKQLRGEIRKAEREEYLREAKKLASEGDTELQNELSLNEVGANIEREYPQFVKGQEKFNAEAYDELMELYVGYLGSGNYTKAQALQKASERAVRIYDFKAVSDTEPEPELESKSDNVVDLKKPDNRKKAEAAKQQPPEMESGAEKEEEPRVDVSSMSDEEYEKLPESAKRRLRGDIL